MRNKILNTATASFLQMFFLHSGSLIITLSLTRILSVSEFGIISVINTIIYFLIIMFTMGVPNSLARFIVKYDSYEYYKEIIKRGLLALLPWLLLSSIGYFIFFYKYSSSLVLGIDLDSFKYILYMIVIVEVARLCIDKISHGTLNMSISAKMSAYSAILMVATMIPVAYLYGSALSVLVAKAFSLLVPILYIVVKLTDALKNTKNDNVDYIVPEKTDIIKYGVPLSIISLAGFGFLQVDILFIAFYLSPEYVAYYSIAIFIFSRLVTLPRALGNGLAPVLAKNKSETENIYYYQISILVTMAFCLPIIIYVLIDGGELLEFIFGSDYAKANIVLSILSIYFLIASLLSIINPILDFSGKAGIRAKAVLLGASVNIALDIILIPKYGMNGAAIATVIGYLVFFMVVIFSINRCILKGLVFYKPIYKLAGIFIFLIIPVLITIKYIMPGYSMVLNGLTLLIFYPIMIDFFRIIELKVVLNKFKSL